MTNRGGFTLLEVLIVLLLTSVIGTMLARWQWQQEEALQSLDRRMQTQELATTALAHLRRDLARSDALLPALSDIAAGPTVLIARRQLRDAAGFAGPAQELIVYHLNDGWLKRTLIGSDASTLAQPVGRLPATSAFEFLDGRGAVITPAESAGAHSIRLAGHQLRLGGGVAP